MKPSFALNLTDDSIALLHRTARGWLEVGATPIDTPDLAEALGYLRGSALGLSPRGVTTKLVIPNSQILYMEVTAPGPDIKLRRAQIRSALEGRTPYDVKDLVFDWFGNGETVQVAVVARETLDEAEAFANEHRFNPLSFVAIPPAGAFGKEPWFGASAMSAKLLPEGEKVERDQDPVMIVSREAPKPREEAEPPLVVDPPEPVAEPVAKAAPEPQEPARPLPPPVSAPVAAAAPVTEPVVAPAPAVKPPAAAKPVPPAEPVPVIEPAASAVPAPRRPADPAPERASASPAATDARPAAFAEPKAASFAQKPASRPAPAADTAPSVIDPSIPEAPFVAVPDNYPPTPGFASRRAADGAPPPLGAAKSAKAAPIPGLPPAPPPTVPRPQVPRTSAPSTGPVQRPIAASRPESAAKSVSAAVTATSIPGGRGRKAKAPPSSTPAGPVQEPGAATMGSFGARQLPQRGKPRFLGLILTALLLLFLAIVAAWSSYYIASRNDDAVPDVAGVQSPVLTDDGETVLAGSGADEPVMVPQALATEDPEPGIEDEMLADLQDPAELSSPPAASPDSLGPEETVAAAPQPDPAQPDLVQPDLAKPDQVLPELAGADTPQPDLPGAEQALIGAETPAAPQDAAVLQPEPAPQGVATADMARPDSAALPEPQDEVFLTTMDQPRVAAVAAALPLPVPAPDPAPPAQVLPPPFGTFYEFDADGLIRPTADGIVTPEGVTLVAGKPPVLPPQRPAAISAIPDEAAAGVTADVPAAGAVPPQGAAETAVVPQSPETALPFPSDPALAGARPRNRPAGLAPPPGQAEDDAALTDAETLQQAGLRPRERPADAAETAVAARLATQGASLLLASSNAPEPRPALAEPDQPTDPAAGPDGLSIPEAEGSPLAVAVSRRPASRPQDFSKAVEAAVAAAIVRTPDAPPARALQPEEEEEPEVAAAVMPKIPTRASVAKQATFVNAINLSKTNLIGIYGTSAKRYALVRQPNGRYRKVSVGDKVDGGTVAAITSSELRYQKGGRMLTLAMPKG